jgi:hypothetical protein
MMKPMKKTLIATLIPLARAAAALAADVLPDPNKTGGSIRPDGTPAATKFCDDINCRRGSTLTMRSTT